jgi:hypothetical protein
MRRKVVVGILGVLPEEQSGVPDSELADYMRFDLQTPDGKPVLAFRFCPWCGAARTPDAEVRIVDVRLDKPGEEPDFDGPGDEGPSFDPPKDFEPPSSDDDKWK